MREENQPPETDPSASFCVRMASRVDRLPPYMFGRINNLLYEKRRQGNDVIDLGMGNPSDPPEPQVISKLAEAARDPRNHGYSKSNGIQNLRREIASKYLTRFGVRLDPGDRSRWCAWAPRRASATCAWRLMGAGRHGHHSSSLFPGAHVCRGLGRRKRDRPGSARQREIPGQHLLHVSTSLSPPQTAYPELSAQSHRR